MMSLKNSKSELLSIIVSTIQIAMIGPFFSIKEKIKCSTAGKVVLMGGCRLLKSGVDVCVCVCVCMCVCGRVCVFILKCRRRVSTIHDACSFFPVYNFVLQRGGKRSVHN